MSESTKKDFDDKSNPFTTDQVDSESQENEPTVPTPGTEVAIGETKDAHDHLGKKVKDEPKASSTVKNVLYESGTY